MSALLGLWHHAWCLYGAKRVENRNSGMERIERFLYFFTWFVLGIWQEWVANQNTFKLYIQSLETKIIDGQAGDYCSAFHIQLSHFHCNKQVQNNFCSKISTTPVPTLLFTSLNELKFKINLQGYNFPKTVNECVSSPQPQESK